MLRKFLITVIITILCLSVIGLFMYHANRAKNEPITAQEAEELCYTVMGTEDEETGFPFSFGYTETIEQKGKVYHVIRGSWLVNNSHMSYIGDFFVTTDGKEVYTGFVQAGEYTIDSLIWPK